MAWVFDWLSPRTTLNRTRLFSELPRISSGNDHLRHRERPGHWFCIKSLHKTMVLRDSNHIMTYGGPGSPPLWGTLDLGLLRLPHRLPPPPPVRPTVPVRSVRPEAPGRRNSTFAPNRPGRRNRGRSGGGTGAQPGGPVQASLDVV